MERDRTDKKGNAAAGGDRAIWAFAGVVLIFLLWQVLSFFMPGLVFASPVETLKALAQMAGTAVFWQQLFASFERILLGVIFGGAAGFLLGLAAGLNRPLERILEPFRWALTSVPAVVVVVIAMLWFGMGSAMVVFITSLLLAPLVYINTVSGLRMVDESLIEMARIFRFSGWQTLRHIYIPAVMSQVVSAMVIATGMGVRIVILAEVMGASRGIGHALSIARSTIETDELFAWVLVCIWIVWVIEYFLIKPIERRMTARWKI